MALNPNDIENRVFREKIRGYDQDEVDEFLDQVAARLAQLTRERDDIAERLRRTESDATEAMDTERLLKRTLIMAQRTADQAVAEAREQAEATTGEADRYAAEVVAEAERRAGELTEDTQRRAAEMAAEAERRAAELLGDARREAEYARQTAAAELETVHRAVAELRRFRAEYRERVHAVIAEQLDAFDRAGELPELPRGLVDVAAEADEVVAGRQPPAVRGRDQVGAARSDADPDSADGDGSDAEASARREAAPSSRVGRAPDLGERR